LAREHVHLIGIGGTGMTALAGLLEADGCRVTGSDGALYPPTSKILERLGLEVHASFDPDHLDPAPDLVVVGNAASRGNPEIEETLDRNLRYTSMPRLISERFLRRRHSVVVAGTHGKTSTTSMLAWVLAHAGRDPGFLVGGLPCNFDLPFRLGNGPVFVIEGDEYDSAFFDKGPKFMHYRPDTALVGTVEFDHADIYRDLDQVKTAFRRLVNLVPRRGLVVMHEDSPATREVTGAAHCTVEGYGIERGDWRAVDFHDSPDGARFRVLRRGEDFGEIRLVVGGEHNAQNALAVIAAATEQGLEPSEVVEGLASFRGVRRRLEIRGEAAGVTVLDDFAHHPTAIDATLRAVRRRYGGARVWAVLEPRSWSLRRRVFQQRLAEAFDAADEVVITSVYRAADIPEDQRLDPERLALDIDARGTSARFLGQVDSIVSELVEATRPGDVIVVMSNGAFEGLHERLLDALRGRAEAVGGA
jgi:UDP-N-acetylmuramate: L-alanyl-gamma-D-glutamyl-meso-diaminopimelate ligase